MLIKIFFKLISIFFILAFFSGSVFADFISVKTKKALLYEGPSASTKKLYIVTEGYPLEIMVNLKDWKKVKDHTGNISWIQSNFADKNRTVMTIKSNVNLYHKASLQSSKLGQISKFVILNLNSTLVTDGWVNVQSQLEGLSGFVRLDKVWGL